MSRFFEFAQHGTTWRTEVTAGFATFLTMAYIIVVNPAILEAAGLPREASITATILSAAFGTLIMGVYARRPFAIAPYMGENAFIVFTVVKGLGFPWQTALGAIFLAGVLFTLLTLLGVRRWLAAGIPANLKHSFTVGIGLFLTFIGLNAMGVVQLGVPGSPVALGALNRATTLVAIGGFFATAVLLARKHRSALLLPAGVASAPPSLAPLFGQLDIAGALTLKALPVVVIVFVMAFVDTIGTLIGLGARAGLLDASGNLPDMEKPMLADAVVNMAAPVFGTTTCGAFVESAVGIEAGGRTWVTAIVVAVLFLASLFFAPLFTAIPAHATGVAIASMGVLMLGAMAALDFADYTEWVPAFLTIVLMAFTYNIGVGMTAGLLAYPVLKVGTGRATEVPAAMWWLAAMSLLFYAVYPYH
jgi:AGZA family xanthine/uracil permease-like MFS transporter